MKTLTVGVLILLCCASISVTAQNSHSNAGKAAMVEYAPGQVWQTSSGATVTILLIEDVRKRKIVHVRIDNVPGESCGSIHLTTQLNHVAFPEKLMRKSDLVLLKEDTEVPDSYLESYRQWARTKHREIADLTVEVEIERLSHTQGLIICNFLPTQA